MIVELKTKYMGLGKYNITSPGVYEDGAPALTITQMSGEKSITPTVCIDVAPEPGCVMIKDWSENEGILDALICAGIIEKTGRQHSTGYCWAEQCKLTPLGLDIVERGK